ncbi:MAG: helicase C-terminal domain-containing protein [Dehalococcoidia bacterium]|nr:helicase C-terminal domain-containing protein [Dehalococcoidia bacterium]
MTPAYVALDLETTGLSPESCEIIEVGAVRFDLNGEIESFQALVRPRGRVPLFVHRLTSIRAEDLKRAPTFSEIAPGLTAFLGDLPVVAHNASFDLSFLAAQGFAPPAVAFDTYDLASLLLWEAGEYSLQSVAQHLGVDFPQRHRALADAQAAANVFLRLRSRLAEQPLTILIELQRLARAFQWPLSYLLEEILREAPALSTPGAGGETLPALPRVPPPLAAAASRRPVDPEEALATLESPQRRPEAFAGYEHRAEQLAMTRSVAETLSEGGYLVVEAGTGTGKSLAYLVPAALHALRNGARVVISTDTINLQEQLMSKDIPALERLLEAAGKKTGSEPLRHCQLKGRRNYLCPRRFAAFLSAPRNLQEAKLAARILLWLSRTATGDRAELRLPPQQETLWGRVSADSEECLGLPCEHLRRGTCFLQHARKQAESSHLVVVNHALLLADVATGGHVLPEYDHLIIDEAHNLEEEATDQFGFEAGEADLAAFFERVGSRTRTRMSGLIAGLLHALRTLPAESHAEAQSLIDRLASASQEGRRAVPPLFDVLSGFLTTHAAREGDYDQRMLLTRASRAQPGWTAVEVAWEKLDSAMRQAVEALAATAEAVSLGAGGSPLQEELLSETLGLLQDGHRLRRGVASVVSGSDREAITWMTLERSSGRIVLSAAPLEVAGLLQKGLFSKKESVILSGATLSVAGRMDYLCSRIGIEGARELLLGSPFDYERSTLMLLPSNMPEPNENAYQPLLEQALVELCRASGGRALVLFTSHGALQTTYHAIRGRLEEDDVLVLAQGIDGAPKNLLNTLREDHRTVILGTASFWEGVDVVGEALSLLVIARLPFSVPTDPIFASRSELFDDPFMQYALPQAVLRFKQGFGRLIRRKTDRGVVVVLDRRIKSKAYGRAFLESLPACTLREEPLRAMPQAVRDWLSREPGPGA